MAAISGVLSAVCTRMNTVLFRCENVSVCSVLFCICQCRGTCVSDGDPCVERDGRRVCPTWTGHLWCSLTG